MPTKEGLINNVRSANSQRDQRWNDTVYDQHKSARFPRGRPWWGTREYPSEKGKDAGFIGALMPGDSNDPFNSSWSAPWYPEQTVAHQRVGTYRIDLKRMTITWLYASIATEDRAAMEQYYLAAAEIAYQKGWPAPALGEPVSFQIRQILKRPPRSPKIAEAALAGDPWILGNTDQVNEELKALLDGTRPDTLLDDARLAPETVLAKPDDLEDRIAKAVAAALEAKELADAAKRGKGLTAARAAKAAKKVPQVPTAPPAAA